MDGSERKPARELPPRGSRRVLAILRETFSQWLAERAPTMAAAVAFYTIFSLAPVLIIVVVIAGVVFGQDIAQARVLQQVQELAGTQFAQAVQQMIEQAREPVSGTLATIFGVVMLLFGATGVFVELQDSLNRIWNVEPDPRGTFVAMLRGRLLSFAMLIGVGFLLLVSLVVSAVLSSLTDLTGRAVPPLVPVLHLVDFAISFLGIMLAFASLYRLMPDAEVRFRDVWPGAATASLLFVAGKLLLGAYVGRGGFASAYGAAGSLVVILLWVYYSAQILLFGAELTQVYTTSRRPVQASPDAHKTDRPEKRNPLRQQRASSRA